MHSQNNEEEIILSYFKGRTGTFLDLGANDGRTLSNTRELALNGWNGTLVEMIPTCLEELNDLYGHRKDIQIIDKAIGYEDGDMLAYEGGDHLGNDHGLLSTVVKSELKRWKGSKWDNFKETKVESISVYTLLKSLKYDKYNFISIDIEGMDYFVLSQLDLHALGCELLCVEWNGKDANKYINYCSHFGLKEIARNGENLIFGL